MYIISNLSSFNISTYIHPVQTTTRGCGATSSEKLERSIGLSTGVFVAILNIVEIVMIAKINRKKRIYEIILMSLSVSDCMFGFSNAIVSLVYLTPLCKYRNLLGIVYVTYVFFLLTSIFHLIFIAVDRAMAVLIPFKYKTIFTTKRLRIAVFLLWIIALIIGVSMNIAHELETEASVFTHDYIVRQNNTLVLPRRNKPKKRWIVRDFQLVISILIVIMDLLIILCYSVIIYQMNYKNRKAVTTKNEEDQSLPIIFVAIASVFVVFTLPYAITRFYLGRTPFLATWALNLNSGMNSIVYFFRKRIEKYIRDAKVIKIVLDTLRIAELCTKSIKIGRDMIKGKTKDNGNKY